MSLAEKLPSPPTVHEVFATVLADNKRLTRHELERAVALYGHPAIEVEMVLKALVRAGSLVRVEVFKVPDAQPQPEGQQPGDDHHCRIEQRTLRLVEQVNAAPPLALVDHAEAARVEVAQIIERVRRHYPPRKPGDPPRGGRRPKSAFWAAACAGLKALPIGQTYYLIHPERIAKQIAQQASVMICNWRTAKQLAGHFRCRTTDRGVLVTRID